ncbi:MAG TPA: MotA/TolQ/ExbB proton channel family protein [Bacillota bacterium]|nr:MotA/TolQ/ExbB proton channel family protein [Clostridiaceae bacterium]HNR03259.1 MotA/TolQ/ExbB proton channel family protein [Bacillota bacterium]HNT04475.1 MotA/TolQ/ExbB proton channel family protein [Bacillota bacterium]HPX67746.1 MotA/TolQ/ExbB proton channel family protein [Bacillota bacterium]HQA65066.1 MotA/TolQ/ExbB proton channel family protein [Bacillota bacterium]
MGNKVNLWSKIELNKTEIALSLAIKLLLFSGLLGSIIGMISILASLSNLSKIGPNLAVSFLTMLYSVLFVFILLPVQSKVKAMILSMDKEYIDEKSAN